MTAVAPARPRPSAPTQSARPLLRRPLVMCALLLLVYGALSLANDPHAFLGTDTGGKIATVRVMHERGDLDPDLGYWAKELDPDGVAHPIALNFQIDDKWVNVTTLPMIYGALPLYDLGGLRAVLLLPMLGAVVTALGARALARRMAGDGDLAFWIIGLVTPVVIYALDFWEHTLGLACMVWGVVLLLDVVNGKRRWPAAFVGGALFGAAAMMRTEALVYALATFAVLGIAALVRRRALPWREAGAGLVGLGLVVYANQVLEGWALGGTLRTGRASNAAERGASDLVTRANDALVTTVGLNRFASAQDWFLGGCIMALLAAAAGVFLFGRPDQRRAGFMAFGGAVFGYLLWIHEGLGFMPGVFVASPLAVLGLVAGWRRSSVRLVALVAVVALPLVWAFQYSGGAHPQWGGRYVLCSSTLLAVIGVVALREIPRRAAIAFVVVAALITVTGLMWVSVRTHHVANAIEAIDRVDEPVLAVQLPHLLREGGAFYDTQQRWLTAERDSELPTALDVLDRSGADGFTMVSLNREAARPELGRFERGDSRRVEFVLGIQLLLTEYHRTGTR